MNREKSSPVANLFAIHSRQMALLNLANRIASKQVACSKNRKNGRLWPNCIRQRQGHGVLQPVASYADAKAERLMLPDFIDYRSG